MSAFLKTVVEAKDLHEINIGDIIRKERGPSSPHILRLVGNPLIVKQMVVEVC